MCLGPSFQWVKVNAPSGWEDTIRSFEVSGICMKAPQCHPASAESGCGLLCSVYLTNGACQTRRLTWSMDCCPLGSPTSSNWCSCSWLAEIAEQKVKQETAVEKEDYEAALNVPRPALKSWKEKSQNHRDMKVTATVNDSRIRWNWMTGVPVSNKASDIELPKGMNDRLKHGQDKAVEAACAIRRNRAGFWWRQPSDWQLPLRWSDRLVRLSWLSN